MTKAAEATRYAPPLLQAVRRGADLLTPKARLEMRNPVEVGARNNTLLAFFFVRCEFREMGTPVARNLISVRCNFTISLFLEIHTQIRESQRGRDHRLRHRDLRVGPDVLHLPRTTGRSADRSSRGEKIVTVVRFNVDTSCVFPRFSKSRKFSTLSLCENHWLHSGPFG